MRISAGVEWALHCCSVLAVVPPGKAMPASKLAEYHDVPSAYLAKQLQALSAADIVESVPGPRGGYRLARPPADVSVLDVVLAIEGDDAAFACTEIRQRGPAACAPSAYPRPCGIARVMWEAEDAWRRSLADHSVADLLGMAIAEAPPKQLTIGGKWIEEVIR